MTFDELKSLAIKTMETENNKEYFKSSKAIELGDNGAVNYDGFKDNCGMTCGIGTFLRSIKTYNSIRLYVKTTGTSELDSKSEQQDSSSSDSSKSLIGPSSRVPQSKRAALSSSSESSFDDGIATTSTKSTMTDYTKGTNEPPATSTASATSLNSSINFASAHVDPYTPSFPTISKTLRAQDLSSISKKNSFLSGNLKRDSSQNNSPSVTKVHLSRRPLTLLSSKKLVQKSNAANIQLSQQLSKPHSDSEIQTAAPKTDATPANTSDASSLQWFDSDKSFDWENSNQSEPDDNGSDEDSGEFDIQVREIPLSELTFSSDDDANVLGKGGYGTVVKGLWRRNTPVAVKIVPIKESSKYFTREIATLDRISHPNVVKLLGYTTHPKWLITMELVVGATLREALFDSRVKQLFRLSGSSNIFNKNHVASQMSSAISYLHSLDVPIVHGDMKPDNVLVENNLQVKIVDFGLSRFEQMSTAFHTTAGNYQHGTEIYMPPEVLRQGKRGGKAGDVWSLGLTINEMYSENLNWPFTSRFPVLQLNKFFAQRMIPDLSKVPKEFVRVLKRCFRYNISKRATAEEVLKAYSPDED